MIIRRGTRHSKKGGNIRNMPPFHDALVSQRHTAVVVGVLLYGILFQKDLKDLTHQKTQEKYHINIPLSPLLDPRRLQIP